MVVYVFLIKQLEYNINKGQAQTFISASGPPLYYMNGTDAQILNMNWITGGGFSSSDNVVLPTRLRVTPNQQAGTCPMVTLPCTTAAQCDNATYPNYDLMGTCTQYGNGMSGCDAETWCPFPNANNNTVTQVYNVIGAENYKITFAARVVFDAKQALQISLDNQTQVNYPSSNFTSIAVSDLLQLAGTTFPQVQYVGAIILIKLKFDCTGNKDITDNDCTYSIDASLADQGNGFTKTSVQYAVNAAGTTTRTHYSYSGLRIAFDTVGYVTMVSVQNIILHLYNMLALIYGISFLTDFVMLNLFREKRHYVELKFSQFDINEPEPRKSSSSADEESRYGRDSREERKTS